MSDQAPTLIRSKLQVPSPSGLLHRSRLCQALNRGLERKLTIVSAPAGYGKTSALVDFARQAPIPVCWYTVDERDRDLSLFVRYVIGAMRERFPGFGDQVKAVLSDRRADLLQEPTAVIGDLVNEMLDLDTEFVLVFDNFEPVDGALGIREFVHRLLEVLPANCHLMMGSRVLPDVPVTKLVAKRELVGLTEEHLRFTPPEISELLGRSGVDVSSSQAAAIASRAEGWVTGVLLIADLLREEVRVLPQRLERVTAQTYGYLASEVLERQPPDVRHFLYGSSCLRELSPRLCREALHLEGAWSLLAEAERRNLFLTRFGSGGRALYRYHKLFRDFLQAKLQALEPTLYQDLHRRAAVWFDERHDVDEAVYHYLAAEAYPEATALMDRVAMEWFTRGRVETLLRWAESMPEDVRRQAPRLALFQGKILTDRLEYEEALHALDQAEAGFVSRGDSRRLARVHDQRAALALLRGQLQVAIRESEQALRMLSSEQTAERAGARRLIGRAYVRQGHLAEGIRELEAALALFREAGSRYNVLNVLQDLTFAFASQGQLDEAAACLNEALPLARRLGSPTQLAGVLNNLGMLHYERGDYQKAISLHQEGLGVAQRADDARNQGHLATGMATLYRDAGACERAERLYEVAWHAVRGSSPRQAVGILAARADMYRWRGDPARALALLRQAKELSEESGLEGSLRGILALGEGAALAECGEGEAGLELLSEGVSYLEGQGAQGDLGRGLFLRAKTHLLAGDRREALADLARAMDLAEELSTLQFAVAEAWRAENLVQLGLAQGVAGCVQLQKGVERLQAFGRELTGDQMRPVPQSRGRLEVYALGDTRVVRDGRPIPGSAWQAAMAKELFFYILLHGPVGRDAVGLIFWPDLPADKVTSNFHSTLYRVRRAVGGETVVVRNGHYQMGDVEYWFDVEEFESLVERAQFLPPHDWQAEELWRRAVTLYRGDFLSDVDRPWCVPRREELRAKFVQSLIGVARCHEVRGAYEDAVHWFERALKVDALREELHRRIMRCYAEAGRRSKALAQYEMCRAILRRELGVEPSRETIDLHEQLAGPPSVRES